MQQKKEPICVCVCFSEDHLICNQTHTQVLSVTAGTEMARGRTWLRHLNSPRNLIPNIYPVLSQSVKLLSYKMR